LRNTVASVHPLKRELRFHVRQQNIASVSAIYIFLLELSDVVHYLASFVLGVTTHLSAFYDFIATEYPGHIHHSEQHTFMK